MRESRYVSLIPRTTLHSDSEQFHPNQSESFDPLVRCLTCRVVLAQIVILKQCPANSKRGRDLARSNRAGNWRSTRFSF
jgi:hypothetical protein